MASHMPEFLFLWNCTSDSEDLWLSVKEVANGSWRAAFHVPLNKARPASVLAPVSKVTSASSSPDALIIRLSRGS